jgi:hypothetical protein
MFKKSKAYIKSLITLHHKSTLANLLNYLAIRLFRISKSLVGKLISYAIDLDPHRGLFRDNLRNLDIKQSYSGFKKFKLRFYSIPEAYESLSQKLCYITKDQKAELSSPQPLNNDFAIPNGYQCTVKLPDCYLAELEEVKVFAGTDLIILKDTVLYDEIDREKLGVYSLKTKRIYNLSKEFITVSVPTYIEKIEEPAIHFAKDYSFNYYHWLLEALPRLSLIEGLEPDIPLLVDEDIAPQSLEALQILNKPARKLIKLSANKSYIVKKLYYPSPLSIIHDNYDMPDFCKDVILSKIAINFVRTRALEAYQIKQDIPYRKIYISRKNSDNRQLLNSIEIENKLVCHGFEIVFPEHMSFFSQVKMFSQAKIIIGQCGAGMTNMIFAPKDCRSFIMIGDAPQNNMHLFHSLAESVGINLYFIIGRNIGLDLPLISPIHRDFYIDIKLIDQILYPDYRD